MELFFYVCLYVRTQMSVCHAVRIDGPIAPTHSATLTYIWHDFRKMQSGTINDASKASKVNYLEQIDVLDD